MSQTCLSRRRLDAAVAPKTVTELRRCHEVFVLHLCRAQTHTRLTLCYTCYRVQDDNVSMFAQNVSLSLRDTGLLPSEGHCED